LPIKPHQPTRAVFIGTSDFAVPALHRLVTNGPELVAVITQPDRPAGRGRVQSVSPVKRAAVEMGLPVWQPERIKADESIQCIREVAPDLIIVTAYGQILPQSILDIPPHGCLNLHGSLLPRLRGASPVAFAILEGHSETGVTVMLMDAGMDTGPILAQRSTSIGDYDTSTTLGLRLAKMSANLLAETIPLWISGDIQPIGQDNSLATYSRIISKTDGQIDWSSDAEAICRKVRAFDPWPGTYTYWGGQRLKVLSAVPVMESAKATPGLVEIIDNPHTPVVIHTARGALAPLRLQMEGRKPMPVVEFLQGQPHFGSALLG